MSQLERGIQSEVLQRLQHAYTSLDYARRYLLQDIFLRDVTDLGCVKLYKAFSLLNPRFRGDLLSGNYCLIQVWKKASLVESHSADFQLRKPRFVDRNRISGK